MQTRLPRFDRLFHYVIGVLFLRHVFDLWKKDLVHACIWISVGKFEEIVVVEVRHFFAQPLVLNSIEIAIQNEMFPKLDPTYLLSYAWIF